jgi:hypothetical protein
MSGATPGRLVGEPFGQAVSCAGLVLLAPFLPRLFDALGIVRHGERRIPPVALVRAAAVLRHAATASDEGHEFDLGLIKVLIGLRPDSPLPYAAGTLRDGDRDGIDGLLHAVIEHWQALKRTSVAGLREAFLQRPGTLREDDIGWRLRVEHAMHDVLLDLLPWTFGTVVLPWVSKPLFTEWTTH